MTDIRKIVDRVAEVLGDAATPERVEGIAQILLDELAVDGRSAPGETSGNRVIITAYGMDRPGILATVTNCIWEAGCNILDVTQKILQEYFTLIMVADISSLQGDIAELQRDLNKVGESLGVRVMVQHEDLFSAMHNP